MGKTKPNFHLVKSTEDKILDTSSRTSNDESMFKNSKLNDLLLQLDSSEDVLRYNSIIGISYIVNRLVLTSGSKRSEERMKEVNLMLNTKHINKLFHRIVDRSKDIQLAAVGILKNLTILGGFSASESFVKRGIVSFLLKTFENCAKDVVVFSKKTSMAVVKNVKNSSDVIMNFETSKSLTVSKQFSLSVNLFVEILKLMKCISTDTSQGTNAFSQNQMMIKVFFGLLDNIKPTTPPKIELLEGIVETLNVLLDENEVLVKNFSTLKNSNNLKEGLNTTVSYFIKLFKNNKYSGFFRVCVSGIILSFISFVGMKDRFKLIEGISSFLIQCMKYNPTEELQKNGPTIVSKEKDMVENGSPENECPERIVFRKNVKTLSMSIEVFTNILSILPKEIVKNGISVFEKFVTGKNVISHVLSNFQYLFKIVNSKMEGSAMFQKEVSMIYTAILRNCSCLNNVVLSTSVNVLNKAGVGKMWGLLMQLIMKLFQFNKNDDEKLMDSLETITSLLVVMSKKGNLSITVVSENVSFFEKLASYPKSDFVRSNSICVLAQFVKRSKQKDITAVVKLFIQKLQDPSISVTLEVVNCLFDVFQFSTYDKVLFELGILKKMEIIRQLLVKKVSSDKNMDNSLREDIRECCGNIVNFIKYKTKK